MSASGRGPACFLQGAGFRTDHAQVRTTRRPPQVCVVRADWLRVCGGCYIRIGMGEAPDHMAAVRGHAHLATSFVSHKRPRQGDAGDDGAGTGNENEIGKDADTFRGFPHWVTRVYGEGDFSRSFRQASRCSSPARARL